MVKIANKAVSVRALWDDEAKVWVATSDDVPGLATEAPTLEELSKKLQVIVPELLRANMLIPDGEAFEIPLHLLSERSDIIKVGS